MTWWDELKNDLNEEIAVMRAAGNHDRAKRDYFDAVEDGLCKAIDILEFYEKQMEPDA